MHKPEFFFWIIGVYAPTTNCPVGDLEDFYRDMTRTIQNKITPRDSLYVTAGDFNAVLDHNKDVYNAKRAPTVYRADTLLINTNEELGWVCPASTIRDRHPKLHFTHHTVLPTPEGEERDPMNITYRRIDHIFVNTTQGIMKLHINNLGSNSLGITHGKGEGQFGDHTPVSLDISLEEWECAHLPELYEMPQIFKTRFPKSNHESYQLLIDTIAGLATGPESSTGLDAAQIAMVVQPNMFNTCATTADIDHNADVLTKVLGKHITEHFKHGFVPGQTKHSSTKK